MTKKNGKNKSVNISIICVISVLKKRNKYESEKADTCKK
jgi:hypothetical protein